MSMDFWRGLFRIWCFVWRWPHPMDGQGTAVANGCGIELGESVALSWNLANWRGLWSTSYYTGVSCSSLTNSAMYSVEIGQCTTGLLIGSGIVNIIDGYFESNTTAINAAAGMFLVTGFWPGPQTPSPIPINGCIAMDIKTPAWRLMLRPRIAFPAPVPFPMMLRFMMVMELSAAADNRYFTAPYAGYYLVARLWILLLRQTSIFFDAVLKNDVAVQSGQVLYHASPLNRLAHGWPTIGLLRKDDRLAFRDRVCGHGYLCGADRCLECRNLTRMGIAQGWQKYGKS